MSKKFPIFVKHDLPRGPFLKNSKHLFFSGDERIVKDRGNNYFTISVKPHLRTHRKRAGGLTNHAQMIILEETEINIWKDARIPFKYS